MDAKDFNASGETKDSLTFEANNQTLIIYGHKSLRWAETGRPPRTSSTPSGLKDKILAWMGYRGIGQDLTDKKKEGLARFLTWRINTIGTLLWRSHGSKGKKRNIYSEELDVMVGKIEDKIVISIVKQITDGIDGTGKARSTVSRG
jgi:hypothetical protein